MSKVALIICVILTSYALAFNVNTDNLSEDKITVSNYLHSGKYLQDVSDVAEKALSYLQFYKRSNATKKLAVVFDIDSTLLSDLYAAESYGFGGNQKIFDSIVKSADLEPLLPVVQVFNWARDHNVAVFIITGRPDDLKECTINNLNKHNIYGWKKMFFWPRNSRMTVKQFKSNIRKSIFEDGYIIVLNIGDQQSDLDGGYAVKDFKLPNPFYLIPSDHKRS